MSDGFAQADQANRLANLIRFGLVAEVKMDGSLSRVRVEIEEGWLSDWLPVFQVAAGRVLTWCAPQVGEQVVVLSPSGELAAGAAIRGLNYDGRAVPSTEELQTILALWDDGAADAYDEATKTRTITLPEGGKLHLVAGSVIVRIESGAVVIDAAGKPVTVKGDPINLDGPVNLGGTGGAAVARVGDPIVNNKISSGSAKVKAA
ncbi:phage baseplate assembly protein V [Brevundimonas faecalis]|uniref:phage baseplate assembly protein V n=1 Tax=Brevundimonas faecalis TaxID=947378 RepID=UPI00361A672B